MEIQNKIYHIPWKRWALGTEFPPIYILIND